MKKVIATFCLIGATLGLAACNTTGTGGVGSSAPYSMERTASGQSMAKGSATPETITEADSMFKKAQTK